MKQEHTRGGGAGRSGTGRKQDGKRKPPKGGTAAKLTLGIVTLCNLGLTVALHVLRRQDIIHAVETDEGVKVLLTAEKKTDGKAR